MPPRPLRDVFQRYHTTGSPRLILRGPPRHVWDSLSSQLVPLSPRSHCSFPYVWSFLPGTPVSPPKNLHLPETCYKSKPLLGFHGPSCRSTPPSNLSVHSRDIQSDPNFKPQTGSNVPRLDIPGRPLIIPEKTFPSFALRPGRGLHLHVPSRRDGPSLPTNLCPPTR